MKDFVDSEAKAMEVYIAYSTCWRGKHIHLKASLQTLR